MVEKKTEQLSVQDVIGLNVVDANANNFGKIDDIHIDVKSGKIVSLVIKEGLMGHRYEISSSEVDRVGDRVVLNVGQETVKERTKAQKATEAAATEFEEPETEEADRSS